MSQGFGSGVVPTADCEYCHGTGRADEANECGFCANTCVSSGKQHWIVRFAERGGVVEFHRWDTDQDTAVDDARQGFLGAYGFWPSDPVSVVPCSGCGDR